MTESGFDERSVLQEILAEILLLKSGMETSLRLMEEISFKLEKFNEIQLSKVRIYLIGPRLDFRKMDKILSNSPRPSPPRCHFNKQQPQ